MNEPVTQAQDHDRRIGRLEGIVEQLAEQGRQTNERFDRLEKAIQEQGRELRQAIAEQGRQTNERFDATNARIDTLIRWLVGMQVASLLALGTLILTRLPG